MSQKKLGRFQEAKEEKEYWLAKLSSGSGGAHLLPDHERPSDYSPHDAQLDLSFSPEFLSKLTKLTGASPFLTYTVLVTALKICLHKYSGSSVVAIGSPARRSAESAQPANALVIVTEVDPQLTGQQLLTNVRQNLLDAHARQNYPFEQILRALKLDDVGEQCPLFEIAVEMNGFHSSLPPVKNDLTITFAQSEGELTGNVRYSSRLFNSQSIRQLTRRFTDVLSQLLENVAKPISEITLLTDSERRELLVEWNGSTVDYPTQNCIHQLFEAQVERTPDAIALAYEGGSLTYRELDQRSNQLAHYLQALGVGPEVVAGVSMPRSPETIISILGILKAGGAYLPLDPSHPAERIAYMSELAQPLVVLTENTDWELIARESSERPASAVTPDNLAYVIFTSGSMGRPKGVAVPHRGLCNCFFTQSDYFKLSSLDRILQFASVNFDASVFEIVMALCSGARLFMPRQHSLLVGSALLELLRDEQISIATLPPSVVMSLPAQSLAHLRTMILAGEACREEIVERWAGGRELFNLYGPTETTIWATGTKCETGGGKPSIGKAINNSRIYILNHQQQLSAGGVPGEIYIGGAGVARGYINQFELTAERFVPDEFSGVAGARLYRTGDLARYNSNGEIEFLGRVDEQVKLRGFRIEPGEIETVLVQEAGVEAALVVVNGDGADGEQLVAYVVGDIPDTNVLRVALRQKLPEYMVPAFFVSIDEIPLTINGKVDKRALPPVTRAVARAAADDQDLSAVEEMLSNIWASVLNRESVRLDDNFIELGGHSLLATQVMTRVNEAFGIDLSLRVLFEAATLGELVQKVESESKANRSLPAKPLERVATENNLPLSFAQQRLLFLDQMEPGNWLYNSPIARRLLGPLNVAALAQSFTEIVRRHEVLRTSFPIVGGQPVQAITTAKPFELIVTDLSTLAGEERERKAQSQADAEARTPFDLEHGPLFRVKLLKLADDEHLLLLTIHHIINDAWSLGLLFRELSTLYNAFSENRPSPFVELPVQYADYAVWQRDYLQGEVLDEQVNYWKAALGGAPALLELPADRPRPAVQSYHGAAETFRLPAEVGHRLKELSRGEGVTLFMTLLAVFQVLLARYTGQEDIVVGTPIAGRTRKETERLIGLFMNTLALRTRISGRQSFREVLAQVRETCLGAYAHQEIPFERLVEELRPERSLSHQPLFQIFFQFFRVGGEAVGFNGLTQQPFRGKIEKTKFDLTLAMLEDVNGVAGVLEYNTDLFDAATAARMGQHLVNLLTAVGTSPDVPVAFLPLISDDERRRLLSEWNDTAQSHSQTKHIQDLFEQQVERSPNAVAVVCKEQRLTYTELNTRANQLAHHLRTLGVGPDTLVGISTTRSPEMIVALLGILKAGGAYLPLDPDYPAERLRFMMDDSGARWLLTDGETALDLTGVRAVRLDEELIKNQSQENPRVALSPQNLAYVIYTSGSTGKPKGVMIPHASLANFLHSMLREPGLSEPDVLVAVTTLSFDIAALELFLPLAGGARVVIVDRTVSTDSPALAEMFEQSRASIVQATPSTWRMLIDGGWIGSAQMKVLCGGEALSEDLATSLSERVAELWNMYGPTETTIWSTVARVQPGAPVTIGRGIANTKIYLLDQQMEPVPVGVAGELYIGGEGLARGYLGKAELTAERFVPDAFSSTNGARLYRTGDTAKWSAAGQLVYLGRVDSQIKLRGHRIELNEIEAVLKGHESVKEVAVAVAGAGSDARLLAYAVAQPETTLNSVELRGYLRERLPEYMVPAGVVELASLPLTANGKLDRRALSSSKTQFAISAGSVIAPRTAIEERLVQLWRELLQVETVSVDSNFFDLGGHSLLLARLGREVQEIYPIKIQIVDLFKYATIELLAGFISQQLAGDESQPATKLIEPVQVNENTSFANDSIAIIGLSGRFPGASDVQQYWQNLRDGKETISHFSDEELEEAGVRPALLKDPNYVKAHGILDDIDLFDANFFGFSPKEAEIMDPQQRLFMECSWQALESAGYDAERYPGRIGVYAGQSMSTYMLRLLRNAALVRSAGEFPIMIGNREDFLTSRTCYKLNLRGPGVVVQTACSTSLVAVAMACHSLLDGQADIALAGGVSINLLDKSGYYYQTEGIVSPDGHCRAFDERAQGSVGGNGVGVVVLKRLSAALADRDVIHAVIRGAAINNDGSVKIGYTAPSVNGQSEVIAMAQSQAGIDPETLSYIETHGTGTVLGDPIEIAALTQVFRARTTKRGFCAIGSVKTNIGHLDAAAGVAGLIKTVLALEHKQIPPSLHFESPNPQIDFESSPFYVNRGLNEWDRSNGTPRRAAVSSFGIGGTNAHVILEEQPKVIEGSESRLAQLLVLSARSQSALERATYNLSHYLRTHRDASLADVAYTLQAGRKAFSHRRIVVARDTDDAIAALDTRAPSRVFTAERETRQPPIAFMFPGQGTQYAGMGRQLYETERVFREHVDECAQLLEPHLGFDLRELLYGETQSTDAAERLRQTSITQPALFVVEYALAQLWMSWGVRPSALIGHSIGEYVAACLSGVFSLADVLRLVVVRGRLMQQMPAGTMLAVPLPEAEVTPLLNSRLSLASINNPSLCVVAGPAADVHEFEAQLAEQAIVTIRLHTSHAFHSWMMGEALEPFRAELVQVKLNAPTVPFISNVTGNWITDGEATDPDYWVKQLRMTVRLSDGLEQLFKQKAVLIEVGPGQTLTNNAGTHPAKPAEQVVMPSLPHAKQPDEDLTLMLTGLGRLWLAGVAIDWEAFYANERRRRVELPSYPFERERYWIDGAHKRKRAKLEEPAPVITEDQPSAHRRPRLSTEYEAPATDLEKAIAEIWEELLGIKDIGIYDNFFELGGHSLLGTMLLTRLRKMFQVDFALATLFAAPTVAEIALAIEERLIQEVVDLQPA